MTAITKDEIAALPVEFKLNGRTVVGRADEPIIETARKNGIVIPHLCYGGRIRSDGNCRACMVEIKGERVLAPSCCRFPKDGMEVSTESERALKSQKMVLELLLSDMPEKRYTKRNKVDSWARRLGVGLPRFPARQQPRADLSHPAIAVNLDACIQCTRCVRACREEQVNDVIGYAFRGDHSKIVFDLDDPMGASTCVACGECVQVCPTGALMPAREVGLVEVGQESRLGLPVLRRRVPADLSHQGQPDPPRRGRQRPRERRAAVREGPLRLRLRQSPAAADEAARAQTGRTEDKGFRRRSRPLAARRSARRPGKRRSTWRRTASRRSATGTVPERSPASARRRARTRRPISSRSWSAPASARTTSTTARGSATRRASRR